MKTKRYAALCLALLLPSLGCPPPPPTELQTTPVGVIVGEVFVEDPDLRSVGDATVQLLGSSYALKTEAGRRFAIPAVPVGEHTLLIEHAPTDRAARLPVTISQAFQTLELSEAAATLARAATVLGAVEVPAGVDGQVVAFLVGGSSELITLVGGDGTFSLASLPTGEATIAVSAPGFAPATAARTLEEGENVLDDAFALTASNMPIGIPHCSAWAGDGRGGPVAAERICDRPLRRHRQQLRRPHRQPA